MVVHKLTWLFRQQQNNISHYVKTVSVILTV